MHLFVRTKRLMPFGEVSASCCQQRMKQWRTGGGEVKLPPKFRRYRWSPRLYEQEEPTSRFPFVIHCVLTLL